MWLTKNISLDDCVVVRIGSKNMNYGHEEDEVT